MKSKTPKPRSPKSPHQTSASSSDSSAPGSKIGTTLGNRTLERLLSSGPARVSQPGDPQEKEAERIAGEVTSPGPHPEQESAMPPLSHASSRLQGLGPGRPLDPAARAMLEPRFGRDLGAVRVHDDAGAAEAARAVEARAFTVGNDVVFSPGQYAPGTPTGQRLLAHELAHVVQPSQAGSPPVVQRSPWDVKRPEPQEKAPTVVPPEIVEIRPEEPVAGQNPKIAMIAGQAKASLRLSRTVVVQIDAFWDLSSNPKVTGAGVRPAEAAHRAEQAKAALVELGVPANRIVTGTLNSNVLSDPKASLGGLVRIALYPTGRPSEVQPALPTPGSPKASPPALGSPPALSPPPSRAPSAPPSPGTFQAPSMPPIGPDKEAKPREGKAGDAVKAFLALPWVKKELDKIKEQAKERALKTWKNMSPGGKAGLITGAVAIHAGAVAGLATHPETARKLLDLIDVEIPLPLPGVPGELKIWISTKKKKEEEKEPKIDMRDSPSPGKLAKPEGPGFLLKWEVKF